MPSLPGIATPSAELLRAVQRQLAGREARVQGAGGAPSVTLARAFDAPSVVAAALQRSQTTLPDVVTHRVVGSIDAPRIVVAPSDLDVTGELAGAGILVVRGTLRVSGQLAFAGLVIALGGIVCEPSSAVQISGAVWRLPGADPRVSLRGRGALRYSSAALAAVDAAFAGLLPHAPALVGWEEVL